MAGESPTLSDVIKLAAEERKKLETAADDIEERIRELEDKNNLTPAERKKLDDGANALSDAIAALNLVTLKAIDGSPELAKLKAGMKAVNENLKQKLDDVNATVKVVQDAAAVVAAVAKIAEEVATL